MIKKYELHILLFITNALSMIIELVAARILSPYYGSSNFVWTIIISMMLFANAAGNLWGGKLSDKYDLNRLKVILLFVSSISLFFVAVINKSILNMADVPLFALIVIALFLIPCTVIGMFSPIINKAVLSVSDDLGDKSGKIYTVITVGSLVGTVIGGLVLIPRFGCSRILYGMAVVFAIYGLTYLIILKSQAKMLIFGGMVVAVICLTAADLSKEKSDMIIVDTDENYVRIFEDESNGETIRYFTVAGGFESACFTDKEKRNELVFSYTKAYDTAFEGLPDAKDLLMLGGAGYSYPRYIVSHYPDKSIDVVEIDGGVTEAAKKYFYLQDFIDEYGTDRLGLYTDDARIYLTDTNKKYDIIYNDTFTGTVPARSLATVEAVKAVKDNLNKEGIYAVNLVGTPEGYRSEFFRSEIKTVASVFDYVWVQKVEGDNYNWMLLASDKGYDFKNQAIEITDSDIIFTDDYAPVEYFSEK